MSKATKMRSLLIAGCSSYPAKGSTQSIAITRGARIRRLVMNLFMRRHFR
jgi:hypothetical protein